MRGPFHLPADIAEGDWIEIGQLGAYGGCLRTAFNGFDRARMVEVRDAPLIAPAADCQSAWPPDQGGGGATAARGDRADQPIAEQRDLRRIGRRLGRYDVKAGIRRQHHIERHHQATRGDIRLDEPRAAERDAKPFNRRLMAMKL